MGMDAEIKAGPWLGDTWGFNNHFIPCTRDSGRDWGWAGGREGTILDAKGAGKRDRNQGNIYLYRYSNIDHISPARCPRAPRRPPQHLLLRTPGSLCCPRAGVSTPPPAPAPTPQSSGPRSPDSGRRGRRGLGRPVLSVRRRRRRQQSGEGLRRAEIPGAGGAGGRGPSAARARGALVHWGALVQRGARRRGGGVQRWARRLGPRIYRFRPGRLGAQVAMQRGEELGAGGRAGVVREGRQAKQALAEAGQVAAGERLGVLGWGPGNPWRRGGGCSRREDGRAGQGPSRGVGRGGAQRYRSRTGAQTETGNQMDRQREKMRETETDTRGCY